MTITANMYPELIADAVDFLQVEDARMAGIIYNPKTVVRVTRVRSKKYGFSKKRFELVVTVCPPNFYERKLIKREHNRFPIEYTKKKK